MAKSLNQNFFTSVLYGSEVASGGLRLDATLSSTKGIVQIAGSSLDLILGSNTGRIVHNNTALRTYTLPDVSGNLLLDGVFTAAYQFIYSTGAGAAGVLNTQASSVLSTSLLGAPTWLGGSSGQFLQIVAGVPAFAALPSTVGSIASSVGNTLPIYQSPGPSNALVPLATISNRVLISPSGTLSWGLISASYLAASGGTPLGAGTIGQKLKSNGDGTFFWANDTAVVNAATQFRFAYYSGATPGSTLDGSSFAEIDESGKVLKLLNRGKLHLFESTANGAAYVELQAPTSIASSLSFTLPGADGSAGSFLTTDGFGNLSFVSVSNGSVASGLANQLAYYATSGSNISGLTTSSSRVLLSPGGSLAWGLITAGYLAALGNTPLGNGTSNNVLVSNGDGTFNWVTATSLVGTVNTGSANQAAYYAASGSSVSPSSFFNIVDGSKRLDLTGNGTLRFYEATSNGVAFVDFKAPALLTSSTSFTLPAADGSSGYALTTNGVGVLSFTEVGSGFVNVGSANQIAYYTGSTTPGGKGIVSGFANVASRVMLTTSGSAISWGLITEGYLSAGSGTPLSGGIANQILTSDGSGNFLWSNVGSLTGTVTSGASGFVTYYPASGSTVKDSGFLYTVNATAELHLNNQGQLRFYEGTNTYYAGFQASSSQASSILWTLPLVDASSSGQVLTSNAAGVLSFQDQVSSGTLNAVAYYSTAGRKISAASTASYTSLGFSLSGSSFAFTGASGGAPTSISMTAGSGVGVAGGSLTLRSGNSDVSTYGSVNLGVGSNDIVSVQDQNPGRYFNILGASTRYYESSLTNYVGFKAPSSPTNVIWALPTADGSANQVLATDGGTKLFWQTVSAAAVGLGATGALSYYSSPTVVTNSQLLIPAGLPITGAQALIVSTSGQISYQNLVNPGATAGYLGIYTGSQSISYSSGLSFDTGALSLKLNNQTQTAWYQPSGSGSNFVGLQAPVSIPTSYTLMLPSTPPQAGYALTALSSTQLAFTDIANQAAVSQKGSVSVASGSNQVTILFATPFATTPGNISAQWSVENITGPSSLPTIAVGSSGSEGFTLLFSTTTTLNYKVYWQANLSGDQTPTAGAYFAGGSDSGSLVSTLKFLAFDVDTSTVSSAGALSALRGYATGASSSLAGYTLGGQVGSSSVTTITSYTYASSTLADQSAQLLTARSGGAGFGNRTNGFAAGGQTLGTGTLTSIEELTLATLTSVTLSANLTAVSLNRASANTNTSAVVVHSDSLSSFDLVSLASGTVTADASNFGVASIQVGCNDNINTIGYFAASTGALYKYFFGSDTVTSLGLTLNSTTGLSGASNSITNGYFSGVTVIDRFNFALQTVTQVNTNGFTSADATSLATFQTNGLL